MKTRQFGKIAYLLVVFCVAAAVASPAQTFTTVRIFDGTDGYRAGSLVQGTNGNFYGTTQWGGPGFSKQDKLLGYGTIFAIAPNGKFTTLYNFCTESLCADGQTPNSGLILAANGNFYGTTFAGGTSTNLPSSGTVFEITPAGQLTTLYSFCQHLSGPACTDGSYPSAGLVQGPNGNFYGTTQSGGTGSTSGGGGTIFEITSAGTLTTLYNFCSQTNCKDGAEPAAALVLASDGNFYGTTEKGGTKDKNPICLSGCGTVFRFTPAGKLTTLYNFCSVSSSLPCEDGSLPTTPLVQGADGALYGTTSAGGYSASEAGSVFRISPSGEMTTIYSFCIEAPCTDGDDPTAGLIEGSDGSLYGTTNQGGLYGGGSAFALSTTGALTTLYSFCPQVSCADGEFPIAGLTQVTNGTFLGTTSAGARLAACDSDGQEGCGTVFSLSTGLDRFVEANPAFGAAGRSVNILGNNLTGATSVTFNGTPATTFIVVSSNLIKAQVPAGATTGTIVVTTPSGTLNSNVAFQVVP